MNPKLAGKAALQPNCASMFTVMYIIILIKLMITYCLISFIEKSSDFCTTFRHNKNGLEQPVKLRWFADIGEG